MKSAARLGLGLVVVASVFAFAGCGDDDSGTDGGGGTAHGGSAQGGEAVGGSSESAQCEEIAELCHPVDSGAGPIHDCHLMAETGNTASCAAQFDDCTELCQAAHDALEGGGGAGGNGAGGNGAGGAAGDAAGGVTAAGTAGNAG